MVHASSGCIDSSFKIVVALFCGDLIIAQKSNFIISLLLLFFSHVRLYNTPVSVYTRMGAMIYTPYKVMVSILDCAVLNTSSFESG